MTVKHFSPTGEPLELEIQHRTSDRAFGLLFTVLGVLLFAIPRWRTPEVPPRFWALALAIVSGAAALLRPLLLARANRLWFRLGVLLGRVIQPLILGAIYFGVITPTAWVMRLTGRDALRLRLDLAAPTYWITRDPQTPTPRSLELQF